MNVNYTKCRTDFLYFQFISRIYTLEPFIAPFKIDALNKAIFYDVGRNLLLLEEHSLKLISFEIYERRAGKKFLFLNT